MDIREARPVDLERLKQIAARSFTDSRFYADPHFDRAQCDALYATWIERDYEEGRARVLVAECDGVPAAFVTCNCDGGTGNIGLIAVDAAAHRKGLGRRLVSAALHYFAARGMTRSTVVTQGRNIASQRLYQNCGYLLRSTRSVVPPLVYSMSYRIPFNKPGMTGNELRYMSDAIARGHTAGDGEYTGRCHTILQETLGVPRALLTTSCTHALEMSALLLDMQPRRRGDRAVVHVRVHGQRLRAARRAGRCSCDIRPDTLNLDEALHRGD